MKGQSELVIAVAIIMIAIVATTSVILSTETPTGKAPGDSPTTINPTHDGFITHQDFPESYSINSSYNYFEIGLYYFEEHNLREHRAFIKFNLTPEQADGISNATLNLTITKIGGTSCPKLYKIADYGSLGQEDWDITGTYIADLPCQSNASINVPASFITSGINAFLIKAPVTSTEIKYGSMESSLTPSLDLEYTGLSIPAQPIGAEVDAIPGSNPGEIKVTWPTVTGAEYYKLYWTFYATGNAEVITPINLTSITYTTTQSPDEIVPMHTNQVSACNSAGCSYYSGVSSQSIAFPKIGQVNLSPFTGTAGQPITLTVTGEYLPDPAIAATYNWNITNNTAGCPSTATGLNPTITCTQAGSANISLTIQTQLMTGNQTETRDTTITVSSDTTPTITITNPEEGETVSGSMVPIDAQTENEENVTRVQFFINDELKSTDIYPPYWSYTFNSNNYDDGETTLTAKALDSSLNILAEDTITITINNNTTDPIPSTPTGFTTEPGTTPGTIDLEWDAVTGAENYRIEYQWTAGNFEFPLNPVTGTSTTYTLQYNGQPLPPESATYEHFFRIKACNTSGCSNYSSYDSAYAKTGQVDAGEPYTGTTGNPITLNATPSDYWSTNSVFEWVITGNPPAPNAFCTSTATGLTPTITCTNAGSAKATITHTNADGQTSTDTAYITMGTENPPATPTITAQPGITPGHIQLSRSSSSGATYYEIDWWKGTAWQGTFNMAENQMSYDHNPNDPEGTLCKYKIRACNGSENCSAYSSEVSSYPKIGANITGSSTGITGENFTLYGEAEYAINPNYAWDIMSNTAGCNINPQTENVIVNCTSTGSVTIRLIITAGTQTALTTKTVTISDAPETSPETPTNFTAEPGDLAGSINLSWTISENTTYYEIYNTRDDSTDHWILYISGGSSASKVHGPPKPAALQYYKIRACNDTGCSDYSTEIQSYPRIGADADGPYNGTINSTITLNGTAKDTTGTPSYLWEITSNNAGCNLTNETSLNGGITCTTQGTADLKLTVNASSQTESDTSTVTITSEADTEDPTIEITSPTNGETVSGTETIEANATDNIEVRYVKFYIDEVFKANDSSSPYSYNWITGTNGSYEIKAIAEDTSGNTAEEIISVAVNNNSSTPQCGNGIIEGTDEECENDSDCYSMYSRTSCDYQDKEYKTRSVTCTSSCTCSASSWNTSSSSYCSKCNACGDGEINCGETCSTCPSEPECGEDPDIDPPAKPTGLEVTDTTKDSITIKWNPNTENDLKKYEISFGKNSGNYSEEEIVLKNETILTIENLDEDKKYFIAIKAVDLSGNKSIYSNEVSATTDKGDEIIVPKPTGLNAEQKENKVVLEWNHTSPEPDNYIIQKMKKGDSYKELKTTSNNSYEDAAITEGETYYYRIQAYKNGKTSIYSNEVEIKIEKSEVPPKKANLVQWGIGTAIIVVSAALAYVFFTFDI